MEEIKKTAPNTVQENEQEPMKLDDARRVKVLSPGMLVFKRFIRNKLAIVGAVILIFMFLFSFLGAAVSPYGQMQVFYKEEIEPAEFAGAVYNKDFRYIVAEGCSFPASARSAFTLAKNKGQTTFTDGGQEYFYSQLSDNAYAVTVFMPVATVMAKTGKFTPTAGVTVSDGLKEAFSAAQAAGETDFTFEDTAYHISKVDKLSVRLSKSEAIAVASLNIFDAYDLANTSVIDSAAFRIAAEKAIGANDSQFSVNDVTYSVVYNEDSCTITNEAKEPFAEISKSQILINTISPDDVLSIGFKMACRSAITQKESSFTFAPDGVKEETYHLTTGNNGNYTIKADKVKTLIDKYAFPSKDHWLGLDNNGMDLLTRLMYGGRISLMVGFIVVILETVIGVIVGGISGYFGGAVDTALMRFVDLFNSIPFYPVVIIFGSVMDTLQVKAEYRIFLLMVVLGFLGWTGVARTVRGQILSLREQDFMVATEATGIRTSRRIFRHLVPNVMPLLIVQATAGLGGIIITEATLGFLGLGVKYPLASWGSIINTASSANIMTKYWFMWLPAGLLILLTVLGFNFVGDGLRDAYDPKMKR